MTLRTFLVGAVALFAFGAAPVEASPISFDYTFNPTDVLIDNTGDAVCTGTTTTNAVTNTHCQTLSFTYTLAGYNALTDTLSSGTLSLTFYDDNTPGPDRTGNLTETVNISLDGLLTSNSPLLITNGTTSGSPFDTQFDVLAQLQNGVLTVLLSLPSNAIGFNDFYFATSQLVAAGTRTDSTPVPEPAALLLFGAGLLASARKRLRKA